MTAENNDRGTFQLLAENLVLALQPLTEAVSDLDSFKDFMFRLGWEVNSLPSSFTNLANLVKDVQLTMESLPDNANVLQINDLLTKINRIYSAIKSLTEAPDGVDAEAFLAEIGERVFEILLTDYLESEFPGLYRCLEILGIIDQQYHEASSVRPAFIQTRLRFDRVQGIVSNPLSIPEIVYGWGTDDLNFELIAEHVHELLQSLNFPTLIEKVDRLSGSGYQPSSEEISKSIDLMVRIPIFRRSIGDVPVEGSVSILELPAQKNKRPGVIIQPNLSKDIGARFEVSENLTLSIRAGSDLSSVFGILIRPGEISCRYPFQPESTLPDAGFGITIDYMKETPIVLFGSQQKSRLEMKGMSCSLNLDYNQEKSELIFVVEAVLNDLALVIASGEQDSLLAKLLGQSTLRIPFPLVILWSSKTGFHFKGSSELSVSYNPHLNIGGAEVDKLTLQLLSGDRVDPDPNFAAEILVTISGSVGPVSFSIDRVGLQLKALFKDGNAGPFDIDVGVVLPDGVGLAINANGVKGGGFISRAGGQYSGVIDLSIRGYSLQALVVLNTDPHISFLFAIFAEFRTPIQAGGGWKITKIGGLLGINHTVSHASIASGIKSGILDTIMFPANIVSNAPSVISNFKSVFPILYGQNIIGPAIRIAYGTPTLITGDLAVILEFPNPFLLTILGKVTSKIPNQDDPIIKINVGILGALDIVNGKAEVYGSLYDSRILSFSLSGDMAMAINWGFVKNFIFIKNFIFSIGGFNPKFTPPPNFPPFGAPPLKRVNIAFSSNVGLECYMALTSNTFQVGARVDAVFSGGGATISGYLRFDALVQFSPLYYIVDIEGGLSVKFQGVSLANVKFAGFLEGPNPHRIKGAVSFSILWWSISKSVDETFGEQMPEQISQVDPWPVLREALKQNDSWSQDIPAWASISVSIKETSEMADTVQLSYIHLAI